jgi:elongator complex protein 5
MQEFRIPESGISREQIFLLDDHPAYRDKDELSDHGPANEDPTNVTFELGLTQKQRADREGVVLPYFDAQKGGGEGGRILYDMGEDDDFDEEEDEI